MQSHALNGHVCGCEPGGVGRRPPGGGGGGVGLGAARGCGSAAWNCAQYSMTFMMCFRPEWCCFRPGTEECVSEMSQYSQ
eukprot:6189031-Pleurochrysis_carterae.AAC.3